MMACCGGGGEEATRSKRISDDINREKKKVGKIVKLLLLGAGDSGKSTIAKQMKIIHLDGFSEEERKSYRTSVANNVMTSIRTLIHQCWKFGFTFEKANESRAQKIMDIPRETEPHISHELGEDIIALWQDPAIKNTFERSSEFQLNDSTKYYFDNLSRISQDIYIPTEQDILRSRVKTTGVLETAFAVEDILFRLVDVGGQRSERRKWIHCFEDVTAIIFCVALSEYDLKLYEDNETNRMQESLTLFKELCNTQWFTQTSFILFLNKRDIFEDKIKRVPLNVFFPDYTGPNLYDPTTKFIQDKFVALNDNKEKSIYTHLTCATDTGCIEIVFNAVRDIILNKTLSKIGVM